jgi:hypothetical protein
VEPLARYRIAAPVAACVGLAVLVAVRPLPRFRFALLGLVAFVGYGIVQDQFSARLCPEYFTVFHPPIRGVTDPTLLGIAWGFLGAWWGGFLMGYVTGVAATVGPRPPLGVRELFRPMVALVGVMAAVTVLTGVNVGRHAELLGVSLEPPLAALGSPERQRLLLVVACYHFAAYATGVVGSVILFVWVVNQRKKRSFPPLAA